MTIHPLHRGVAPAATANGSTASEEAATIDREYRLLVIRGLSAAEAGNLVAYTHGVHPAESSWTVAQIKHLLAIRSMVASRVIDS
jgi:hypothetical protein